MVKRYKYTPQRMRESTQGTYVQLSDYEDLQQELDITDKHIQFVITESNDLVKQLNALKRENTYHWVGLVLICLVSLSINALF